MINDKKVFLKLIAILLITIILILPSLEVFAYTKEETVYSKMDNNGSVYETIVTDHLKNHENMDVIKDISELMNIKNVNGEEEFSQENNNLIWKANGNDIYYQGESQKELPIECKVKYELDGNELSSEELAGKSGNVKIIIEYINKSAHVVTINGKEETLYTPFVVMAGTIVDNTKIKNITVTNGKIIDNGKNTLIAAIACPGLINSLGIEDLAIEDMNQIEIQFDVTEFEMSNIYSYITPKILSNEDISKLDRLDEIYSKIELLEDSSKQLVNGANDLREGTSIYSQKSKEFGKAMNTFKVGVITANNSYAQIDSGISTINSNIGELQSGANQINSGVGQLGNGLNQLKKGVEDGKNTAISELGKSAQTLDVGIDQVIAGKDQETESIKKQVIESENALLKEELKQGISTNISKDIKSNVETSLESVLADESLGLSNEQKQAIMTSLNNKLNTNKIEDEIDNIVDNKVNTTTKREKAGIDKINNAEGGIKSVLSQLKNQASQSMMAGIKKIGLGFDSISNGTQELINGTQDLKVGSYKLQEGTNQLKSGSKTLKDGSSQLKIGINTLATSSDSLNNANSQLIEGADTISEGANTLAKGMEQFNKEGIQTITSYINGNIKNVQVRLEKIQEFANEYNNFSGIGEEEGEVKFILILDGIKKKRNESEELFIESEKKEEEKEERITSSGE